MVLSDSYSLSLQSEIIANVPGCINLAILDVASFFYECRLYLDHCIKFTIVMYHGQETFLVLIIGYINSVAYVLQEIDNILKKLVLKPVFMWMTLSAELSPYLTSLKNCTSYLTSS